MARGQVFLTHPLMKSILGGPCFYCVKWLFDFILFQILLPSQIRVPWTFRLRPNIHKSPSLLSLYFLQFCTHICQACFISHIACISLGIGDKHFPIVSHNAILSLGVCAVIKSICWGSMLTGMLTQCLILTSQKSEWDWYRRKQPVSGKIGHSLLLNLWTMWTVLCVLPQGLLLAESPSLTVWIQRSLEMQPNEMYRWCLKEGFVLVSAGGRSTIAQD